MGNLLDIDTRQSLINCNELSQKNLTDGLEDSATEFIAMPLVDAEEPLGCLLVSFAGSMHRFGGVSFPRKQRWTEIEKPGSSSKAGSENR